MKKFVLSVVAIALIAGAIVSFQKQKVVGDKPVVKIGATLPLTGNISFAGTSVQKALEMSLADALKNPNLKYDYKLFFADEKMDMKQAHLNASRLQSVNGINALMSMWFTGPALAEYAETHKLLHMGCSWGYDMAKGLYNFNHCSFHPEQTALMIAEFKKRNIRKIAIVSSNTLTGIELHDYAVPELTKAGIKVVADFKVNFDEKDFKPILQKIRNSKPDIIFMLALSSPPPILILPKQAKEMGYDISFTTFDSFAANPEPYEGMWFIADAMGSQAFADRMKAAYGVVAESCAGNLYDGLQILIKAFEETPAEDGKIPDSAAVAATILNFKKLTGVMGDVYIDDDGNIHSAPTVNIIKNGKSVIVR